MKQTTPLPFVNGIDYRDPLLNAMRWSGAVPLTDLAPTRTPWLWPGRISFGNVTLVVSDPGLGKSLLTLDVAARVTTGRPWPDETKAEGGRGKEEGEQVTASSQPFANSSLPDSSPPPSSLRLPPSSVLILNIEDHFSNTIKPRLEAAGADCSRILALTYVPGADDTEPSHLFALNRDLPRLSALFDAMPEIRLVIIDPITAFLGGSDQSNSNVWKILSALASLARRRNLAILAVSHLRKKEGPAIHRTLGSLAFVAAARTVWTMVKDPADSNKRLLLPVKNNLAPSTPGLAFTFDKHESSHAPTIRWLPDAVEADADSMLLPAGLRGRPDEERQYAVHWLRDQLTRGQSPVRTIRNAADAHGISYGTLRRAFRQLGAVAFQPKEVLHGPWIWKLPGSDAQISGGEFCAPDNNTDESITAAEPLDSSTLPTLFPDPNTLTPPTPSPIMRLTIP